MVTNTDFGHFKNLCEVWAYQYNVYIVNVFFHAKCKKPSNVVLPYPTLPPDSASEVTAATDAGGV